MIRLAASHRGPLADLIARTPEFSQEEAAVALELIDAAIEGSPDYRAWVDVADDSDAGGRVRGDICFGKTPMTRATYDLYWIAVDPDLKANGIGRRLVARMEEELAGEGGHLVRVETEGGPAYAPTRAFYDRIGYEVVARIRDFYARGNDLYVYGHYLNDGAGDERAPDTQR